MPQTLPGTTLSWNGEGDAFSVLEPIFAVSGGGLLLSQIAEMTGLSAFSIQNWVKRGWVSKPINKKYGELQVARILLINLLRPAMQLEKIVTLLTFINGSVDDRADDSIPEPALYTLVCTALTRVRVETLIGRESLITLIETQLESYEGPVPDAKQRLCAALTLMLLNIDAAGLMQQADAIYRDISTNIKGG